MLRIDINGPIGIGKTTIAEKLVKLLEEDGYVVVLNHDNQWSDEIVDFHVNEAFKTGKRVALITDGGISEVSRQQAQSQHRKGW